MRVIKFKHWVKYTRRMKQIEAWRRHSAILSSMIDEVLAGRDEK